VAAVVGLAEAIAKGRHSPELTNGLDDDVIIQPIFFLLDGRFESFGLGRTKSD
jgi:hypothetical protein